ncbi:MAG TPA: Tol-Pal system beta propeller repeat protein TolB [Candidatus Polarisedimenticolia bacterium]|nr:Tol-Pal system beta propeller repeat protein TolB [Candidatus Polarisedimenticolia bacterium]
MNRRIHFVLAAALSVWSPAPAGPQDPNGPQIGLTITGAAQKQIPIALPGLRAPSPAGAEAREAGELIRSVLGSDLSFSGLFNVLPPSLYASLTMAGDRIPFRDFAALGATGIVHGTLGGGSQEIVVEGLLFDSKSEALIMGKRYRGAPSLARDIAHRLANDITIAYTGKPGVSLSRIVMVGRVGSAKEIFVMDYDGHDLNQITRNKSLNVSPAWSPDGKRLAFVSYKKGTPRLYVYNGDDGGTQDMSPAGSELCVAPDWSPDGRLIAFSSAKQGDSEIHVLDVATGRSRQITFSRGSDTSPVWSPSGREIAFTSDRSGRPHIYVMDAEGANVRRITNSGEFNDSAAWSPDGSRLAYASRISGRFDILVLDIGGGSTARLTQNAGNNESPRWSRDGRHIVFASNRAGTYRLYTMDADGNRQEMISTQFEATMPDWSR